MKSRATLLSTSQGTSRLIKEKLWDSGKEAVYTMSYKFLNSNKFLDLLIFKSVFYL